MNAGSRRSRILGRFQLAGDGLAALKGAARAAIVIPLVFAFADKVIGDPQTALFAAFGSFAMLVFVDFTGPRRSQFFAYLALAGAGAANVVLGTLCSRDTWVAVAAMALVGFAILLSGAINGYFAAASTSALLTFVLPVTIAAPLSGIPARLEGWGLAAAAGICAHMLLWPGRPHDTVRADAARACVAIADLADSTLARARSARDAVDALRSRFLAAPHRPTGPTGRTAAIASLVDELDWLLSLVEPPADSPRLELSRKEEADVMATTIAVLRESAARLDGREERRGIARLDAAEEAQVQSLAGRIGELLSLRDEQALESALEPAFRVRAISESVRQIAGYAAAAAAPKIDEPHQARWDSAGRWARSALQATSQFAVEHVAPRSVWFRNSIRGAAGLAIAVYIARRTGLQHDFWIVLGTLSVLRSNALGTGSSILSALEGTAVGILVGAALVIAIGTHEAVLWAILPVAILLAAYAPRAISFAAGQAGFTVVLLVLFNLIQPAGWEVGLVRIEDVAIGFAISLGLGLLLWPRGAAALLRDNLAAAYARSADYVAVAARQLIGGGDPARSAEASVAAEAAIHRLDDAFRQLLAERSPGRVNVESVGTLVAGAARVRRAGRSLSVLGRMSDGDAIFARCGANLDAEVDALYSWFITLGDSLVHPTAPPLPHLRNADGRTRLLSVCAKPSSVATKAPRGPSPAVGEPASRQSSAPRVPSWPTRFRVRQRGSRSGSWSSLSPVGEILERLRRATLVVRAPRPGRSASWLGETDVSMPALNRT